jgi:hypothetical protein
MREYPTFWNKVVETDTCWEWTGTTDQKGYAMIYWRGDDHPRGWGMERAHRAAYKMLIGPIPEGMVLDHLCRNRSCVNPDHLEPVAAGVNTSRGDRAHQTLCRRGHPLSGDNLTRHSRTGARVCRQCQQEYKREWARGYRPPARFPRISDETKTEAVRLRASGLSYAAIARQLGISQTSAWKATR